MTLSLFPVSAVMPRHLVSALFCACSVATGSVSFAQQDMSSDSLHLPPEEGGPRRLEVRDTSATLFLEPSDASEPVATLAPKTMLSNLGCVEVETQTWCNASLVKGRKTGFLKADRVAPAVGPDGVIPVGVDDSKDRAQRGDFDATSKIACAQNVGEKLGRCEASIARSGGGDAAIVVTFANKFSRELYFKHGAFMRANSTMSGVGRDTDWRLQDGVYVIRVDDQSFEIDAAFVLGQ